MSKESIKERNEIWNTPEEYVGILLKERNKEKALIKYLRHSACDLAFIKRRVTELRKMKGVDSLEIYLNELISEKRELINILDKEENKEETNK